MAAQWNQIDSATQDALIAWYNVREQDIRAKDRTLLATLHEKGHFQHWTCPECSEDITVGNPEDWSDFQGVNQSEHIGNLCTDCGSMYLRLKSFAGI